MTFGKLLDNRKKLAVCYNLGMLKVN